MPWWLIVLVISGILGIGTLILNLFFSIGDHPEKRWATELPEAGSDAFLTAISRTAGVAVEQGEEILILNNGKEFLPALLRAIRGAQKSINITAYIWADGRMSEQVFEALMERAEAGVEVRILIDGMGGLEAPHKRINELERAGGVVIFFRTPRLGTFTRLHRRTHGRAMVIDGEIAFTGGMAIGDHWLGDARNPKEWRDTMFCVAGRMAQSLQGIFARLWSGTVGEILSGQRFYPRVPKSQHPSRYVSIASSPAAETHALPPFYWFSMSAARKTLYLTYPYVVPGKYIRDALMERAEAGVDVRMLVPGKSQTDIRLTQWAASSYYGVFLGAGIKIYEYQPSLLHSKILTVDGIWSVIGSANMDIRSKEFNEENVLGVADADFASRLDALFFSDLKKAKEVRLEEWRRRNGFLRAFEWIFRLFMKQY